MRGKGEGGSHTVSQGVSVGGGDSSFLCAEAMRATCARRVASGASSGDVVNGQERIFRRNGVVRVDLSGICSRDRPSSDGHAEFTTEQVALAPICKKIVSELVSRQVLGPREQALPATPPPTSAKAPCSTPVSSRRNRHRELDRDKTQRAREEKRLRPSEGEPGGVCERGFMLALAERSCLAPHPHEYRSRCAGQQRMLSRVRSYTPPHAAPAPLVRRCESEGGYRAAQRAAEPAVWTTAAPSIEAEGAQESRKEGQPKFPPPPAPPPSPEPVPQLPCPAPAAETETETETAGASLPLSGPSGTLNKNAILAPKQLAALSLLCHDIGMADDPNERHRGEHEDTAIVLLRLHRTARVGPARAGGVLVPQPTGREVQMQRGRARSSSAGQMQVETPGLPSPRTLPCQLSQRQTETERAGPPAGGLVRQKSTRPLAVSMQRKCRSMTDVFEQQQHKHLSRTISELELASPPGAELFGGGAASRSSSVGGPIGQISPVSTDATEEERAARLLEQDDLIFAGLFDGHGGDECARFLQQNFYRNLSREIAFRCLRDSFSVASLTPELMHDAFTSAYLMSNLQLKSSGNPAALSSGATAVTAVVSRDRETENRWLHLANVGDSAAILCTADHSNGSVWETQRLHQTHRTTTPSERSRVISSGGFILRGRLNGSLAVTRAFGNHHYTVADTVGGRPTEPPQCEPEPQPAACSMEGLSVLPATRSIQLDSEGTEALFLVLCCDGLTDVMSDQQIVQVVHEGYNKLLRRAQREQQEKQRDKQAADGADAPGAGTEAAEGQRETHTATPMMRGVAAKLSRWLVHTALKRGSRDNCSAIVMIF